ncbi:MAG: glycosyltransferase family 2 protein [Candidatus Nitrosocosmicus sp.]
MRLSVILPNYNHSSFLQKRIESILNQTFQDFELIILDDCSSDRSREIIEKYRNHSKVSRIVYNESNSRSPIKQWKKGLAIAKEEWIWLAESDDFADIHFLEKLILFIENDDSIVLAYTQSYDINEKDEIIQSRIHWTSNFGENIWQNAFCIKGNEFLKYLYEKNVIPNASAALVKKDYLQTVLQKEIEIENLKMCGDWFTWLLIANFPSVSIAFLNEHLNYFRDSEQSTRKHNSRVKLTNRLLEEAKIFNSGKFEIDGISLQQKNKSLRIQWLHLFSNQPFSFNLFKIIKIIGISRFSLFKSYQKRKKYS